MLYKKLFVALAAVFSAGALWQVAALLPVETASAQSNANFSEPKDEPKKSDVAPEVQEKAVELLKTSAREAAQSGSIQNRIRGGILAGDLMWERDEEAARATFQAVENDLQTMFGEAVTAAAEEDAAPESYSKRYTLDLLRKEFLLAYAARDPRAALAAYNRLKIDSTAAKDEYDPLKGEGLELEIAAAVAKKDPQQSYDLAFKTLKTTLDYNTINTIGELYKNNQEVGARFARDVLAKLKTAKVRRVSQNTNAIAANAATNANADFYADLSLVTNFLQTAATLNAKTGKTISGDDAKKNRLLTDAEMRELSDLTAQVYIKQGAFEPWTVAASMPAISKYSPAAAQIIRARLNAEQLTQLDAYSESSAYYTERDDKTIDEIVATADKAPPDQRDARYADAITKALEKDELERANEIAAKIRDRKSYSYVLDTIKQSAPQIKARRGDIAEVRKMLGALKTSDEKIEALTELVTTIANKGDKPAAAKLLDEADQFLPAQLKRKPNLDTTLRVANAYALVQPDRAFALIENGIAQMNDIIQAGVLINDFYDYETVEADEVIFDTMLRQGFAHTNNVSSLVKNLAAADFARTVALSDKFARPEIRVFVRLKIAEALLDANAAEREKTLREQYQSEEHAHD